MRRKRGRAVDVEEGESYYVSMTDMMVGVIFIFIIMLSYFAFEFRSATTKLTSVKQPETAALLQTANDLQPRSIDAEIDYKERVLCVPEAALSADGGGAASDRRCFSFSPRAKAVPAAMADSSQKMLMAAIEADLHDSGAPILGDMSGGNLTFRADQLFIADSAELSPAGRRIAGEVALALARRLPCLGYGAPCPSDSQTGGHLAVVNVLSQSNFNAFTDGGQRAAALGLQRSVAFHQALTQAQPVLAALRNAPPSAPGSQPLLQVASLGQSQETVSPQAETQLITLQFLMAAG